MSNSDSDTEEGENTEEGEHIEEGERTEEGEHIDAIEMVPLSTVRKTELVQDASEEESLVSIKFM